MPPRLTLEEVKLAFEAEKCTLLSKEYSTNKKPLEYLCSCGSKEAVFYSITIIRMKGSLFYKDIIGTIISL